MSDMATQQLIGVLGKLADAITKMPGSQRSGVNQTPLAGLVQQLQNLVTATNAQTQQIKTSFPNWVAVPAMATSPGVAGQTAYDSTHFYVCVAASTWVRVALATF